MSDLIDKSKQEDVEKDLKSLRKRDLADIRWVLSKPEGRRFYCRLLSRGRLYQGSFTGNSTTFFHEGIRDFGIWLLQEIMAADHKAFIQLHQEYKSELLSKEKEDERRK